MKWLLCALSVLLASNALAGVAFVCRNARGDIILAVNKPRQCSERIDTTSAEFRRYARVGMFELSAKDQRIADKKLERIALENVGKKPEDVPARDRGVR